MAFREKGAWITVISLVAIYGYYFATALAAGRTGQALLWDLAWAVLLVIGVQIVLNIAAAIVSPREARVPEDEREQLFFLKGMRNAHIVLALGVVLTIGAALLGHDRYALANGLFFALVVADLTKAGTQIVCYRRGA